MRALPITLSRLPLRIPSDKASRFTHLHHSFQLTDDP